MIPLTRTAACLLFSISAHAGILVLRSGKALQFADAAALVVDGKEKVLNLGGQPRLPGPINKLPNVKLAGAVLKDGDSGSLAIYTDGAPQYFVSDGLPKTAGGDVAAIWRMSRIAYKKTANDKTPAAVSVDDFVAFLPGGAGDLAHLCMDQAALEFIGGKGKGFAVQLELTAAAAHAYASDPAMGALQKFVEEAMRQRKDLFENGAAGVEALDQGLEFAKLSLAAYPDVPEQVQLRADLAETRKWLERKMAILRAFAAAEEWDAFLLSDRDFERYPAAFRSMAAMHSEALERSLLLHRRAGEERTREREYGAAYREFRLASLRKPSDTVLRTDMRTAWGNYSNQVAKDRQGSDKSLSQGERSAIAQDLQRAKLDLQVNKPDRALAEVEDAERIDSANLDVLLRKAEALGALHQFRGALAALDEYDMHAVDEERQKALELRANLEFQRDNNLDDIKTQLRKAYAAFSFHQAADLARRGLEAKDDDAELLAASGRLAKILRDPASGRAALQRYLDVTTNLDANEEDRASVRKLLASIRAPQSAGQGAADWLSHAPLPAGVFYSPVSLAFQPRIDRIVTSNKTAFTFDWDGDRLRSITPAFEKDVRAERKIVFGYDDRNSGVTWAGAGSDPRGPATSDPDELFRRSMVRLANNPYADPVAIQSLTGKNVTLGIAGNHFFDPFVWDDVHYFQFTYDDRGCVSQARELADPKAAPGDRWVDFDWDGPRLLAVRAYQGADAAHRSKIYQRTLQYQDNRLVSEEIQFEGKSSRIRYVYSGGRLVSAAGDRDPSLDDRSRQVTFR
ncbi:MAG TPA: hypothetical protein VKF41_07905 [Bryobacteraceae bacterium]|nr:hypothetical protein [Bryobacteraceae bacterium]